MYHLKIQIEGLPKIITNGSHGHWATRAAHAKRWQRAVFIAVGQNRPESPLLRAEIIYTRYSSTRPDFDNLAASFKCVQDGLRLAMVLTDDKYENIGEPKYRWEPAKRGAGFITVEVRGDHQG